MILYYLKLLKLFSLILINISSYITLVQRVFVIYIGRYISYLGYKLLKMLETRKQLLLDILPSASNTIMYF